MFRFKIRDVLWLTVVVAVALALWLNWSREIATLRKESSAREWKLREQAAADRQEMRLEYAKLTAESKTQELGSV
jgi:hypothetical protein